ncbi:unnamed protein product [Paramecium octaurelia]|uniref:Uncharacterized protein n=1 Tax=Paramecium octaurelia TaxID=43137 RepID=A0A8S1XQ61_PAROT|nr:unnamed protein product [Paramecium octaurelia]
MNEKHYMYQEDGCYHQVYGIQKLFLELCGISNYYGLIIKIFITNDAIKQIIKRCQNQSIFIVLECFQYNEKK